MSLFGIGEMMAAGINAATTLSATELANQSNERINRENQEYNDRLIASDRAYNDPSAQAARLRAAGISPSLMGVDNIASNSSPVSAVSNADNIMAAAGNLSDIMQGLSGSLLERDRLSFQKEQFDQSRHEFDVKQENISKEFDLKTRYYNSLIRRSELDADKIDWSNKAEIGALAFDFAVNDMDIPDYFSDDQKQILSDAMRSVDRESFRFRTMRSIAQRDLSAAEADAAWQEAESKYAKSFAGIDVKVQRQTILARGAAELTGKHLQNDAQRIDNNIASQTAASTVESTNAVNRDKVSDTTRKQKYIEETQALIKQLEDALHDRSLRHRIRQLTRLDLTDQQISVYIERLQSAINAVQGVPYEFYPRGLQGTGLQQGFDDFGNIVGSPLKGLLKK